MSCLAFVIAAMISLPHAAADEAITLVTSPIGTGSNAYRIVLPNMPAPAEETAATVLRDTLLEMTGRDLPIIREGEYRSGPMLAVGFHSKLPEPLQRAAFGELKRQELIIQPDGKVLLLAGGSPLGTLYAVYEYLHRHGVRWYTPTYTKIPTCTGIPLPQHPYRYSPPVTGRKGNAGNKATNAWRSRNRLTSKALWSPLGEQYGLSRQAEGPDMHTFWRLIPKDVLRKNPDWLCEIAGKREKPVGTTWGLCLSNPDVRRYVIRRTVQYAAKQPNKNTIWVGQNDGSDFCTCDTCRAFYDTHGGEPSSLTLQIVNELADALPEHMVKTLAYSWSKPAPHNMTARENVMIMLCAQGSLVKPIADDPARQSMRAHFAAWRAIAKHLDVYLYFPHQDYWSPAPVNYVGAENIKWCARHGIRNMNLAISGHGNSFGSEFMHLRSWVYNRLMWDPTLDTQALMDDFMSGYYGPAAKPVKQAITWTHENLYDETGEFIQHENGGVVPHYVNPTVVRRVNQLLEKTYNALPESDYKQHLSYAWIPYLWADFWLGFRTTGRYDRASRTWSVPMVDGTLRNHYARLIKAFMSAHGVNALSEKRKFHPAKLSIDKMGISLPASVLSDGTGEAVVIPSVGGRIHGFRNNKLAFAPLKEVHRGQAMEYPLFSTTEEAVNDNVITEYRLSEESTNSVTLEGKGSTLRKVVSLVDGALTSRCTLTADKPGTYRFRNCIMFDLAEEVFGYHPTLYVEKNDGTWSRHVVGSETDFHWVEGTIDLSDSTGRVMLRRQQGKTGVLMTLHREQLKNLYFWYSRYEKGNPAYCGMLRFFMNANPRVLKEGGELALDWSLRILPDVLNGVRIRPEKQ